MTGKTRIDGDMPAWATRAGVWMLAAATAISLGGSATLAVGRLSGQNGQPISAVPEADTVPRADLAPLIGFAPFGGDILTVPAPTSSNEASLGLTLLGVVIGTLASASRAIIAGGDGSVASYPIGAQMRGNIDAVEINPDRIVLRVDGGPQTLLFPVRATAPATANPAFEDVTEAAPTDPSNAAREVIGSYLSTMQANATGVRDDRKAAPPSDVVPMILQAGMHLHDMIKSTKGSQVGAMKADRQFHDQLAASGRVDVDMRCGGRVIVRALSLG